MNETVKAQILVIRDTGLPNMLDIPMEQLLAHEHEFFELVCWLEEHRRNMSISLWLAKLNNNGFHRVLFEYWLDIRSIYNCR